MKRIISVLLALLMLALPVRAEAPEDAGKASCLMDAATGTLLTARNEHEPLAPASVTKIMTLLLILEAVDSGALGWSDPVTASETAAAKGGSQVYLKAGEVMTVEEMVKAIAVSSANDCACAMSELLAGSESAFVDRMNQRAKELGMADTHFVNCTGLDDGPDAAAHRTSAYDIALMSRELLTKHPDIKKFTTIWMDSVRNGAFGLANTNKLVRFYPGCTGLKTGYTSGAGFCLSASARREELELIAVVLGCKSSKGRFAACRQMLDWGFASYARYEAPAELPPIPVRLGKTDVLIPVPAREPAILVRKTDLGAVRTEISLPPMLEAPVPKGTQLGVLTLTGPDGPLAEIPLIAPEDAERLSFGDLFRLLLGRLAMVRPFAENDGETAGFSRESLEEIAKNAFHIPSSFRLA